MSKLPCHVVDRVMSLLTIMNVFNLTPLLPYQHSWVKYILFKLYIVLLQEARTALDGVPSIEHITNKQMDYVLKVLRIDEATLITFKMFAVVTALCERVTHME